MAKNSIDAIRAKLIASKTPRNTSGGGGSGGDNASYPFWNTPEGQSATLRFLPDKDENNAFFWVKRERIKLPFAGQVGGAYPTHEPVWVDVPCMKMFGEACPITAEISPWWNDESKKEMARTYYRKQSFIYQGFVVSSPFAEPNVPANPIRRFLINKSIHEIIEGSLMDPEMEDVPTDIVSGRDFVVRKTKKDKWANYGTSSWSLRTRSLSADEMDALETHGLFNLADFLGAKPDAAGVQMIVDMFHDSLDGRPFDAERYKPYRGFTNSRAGDNDLPVPAQAQAPRPAAAPASRPVAAPARIPVTAPVVEDEIEETVVASVQTAPVEEPDEAPVATSAAKADPAAILARVRAKITTGSKD